MSNAQIMKPTGEWVWSKTYQEQARVIEKMDLWGSSHYRIWLPNRDTVVLVPDSDIQDRSSVDKGFEVPRIRYILMAAKLANLLTEDVLLAPIDASVIPLPHQIKALKKAVSRDRVRFLLADEVGLGKTIEAGLIMREMKLRGFVKRTLVVSPRGLITQWISEMKTHFGEEFRYYAPGDFQAYRRIAQDENVWQSYDQIICSVDSVKPVDSRKGWSEDRLMEFNKERFQDLVTASWDLIIVDESHRLGGSSEQVARYQLGKALAEAAPYLLLLTATPHQGKTDAFHRLISLLDPKAFPDPVSVTKERILPYVIRTEKRQAIDADGKALFKPRVTKLVSIDWKPEHQKQKLLYDAVTLYVREGYNQALKEKKGYIGFLMILMQRLVTSSTRAITATLERRLDALRQPEEQMSLFPEVFEEEWPEMDGQDQLESVLKARLKALKNEKAEVRLLLNLAKEVEAGGSDAKADALLAWLYTLQQEESDPDLKFLIFTEFVATQQMLEEFLLNRGFSVVCLNGSMDMEQRFHVQTLFSKEVRILISTDAGGEGLNLQFCHVVINYDIPWNPMRLEQRIGRVDRIGQEKIVRAMNFIAEDTIEHRVLEVLEDKLFVILQEFGVDKTSDVLDSAEGGNLFDSLYMEALLNPEHLDDKVQRVAATIRKEAELARAKNSLFDDAISLQLDEARQAGAFPLADWVEKMTGNYLEAFGGDMKSCGERAVLTWPGHTESRSVTFARKGLNAEAGAEILSLEHPRIRGLISRLPCFAEGQPVSRIKMQGMPANINGYWSLWQISMHFSDKVHKKIMPLFVHDDGRNLQPTARFLWDQMNMDPWSMEGEIGGKEAREIFKQSKDVATLQGHDIYLALRQKHLNRIHLESEKAEYSFNARRRLLANVGLAQVRAYRLRQLENEETSCKAGLERQKQILPELIPLLMLRID
ncbi:MAG TPA: DEAD/DEAH box helicase [Deltaproteobacteria bacterium]|nr:DEAD/DEAH box helicase [Deltaproteobacteria bacterium]